MANSTVFTSFGSVLLFRSAVEHAHCEPVEDLFKCHWQEMLREKARIDRFYL